MANVLFTRDTLTNIEDSSIHPVTDGQLLFDTSGSGKMYMDVGTSRLEMGGAMTIDSKLNTTSTNPIQNKAVGGVMLSTLDEIAATTSSGFLTDALATKELNTKTTSIQTTLSSTNNTVANLSTAVSSMKSGSYGYWYTSGSIIPTSITTAMTMTVQPGSYLFFCAYELRNTVGSAMDITGYFFNAKTNQQLSDFTTYIAPAGSPTGTFSSSMMVLYTLTETANIDFRVKSAATGTKLAHAYMGRLKYA